MPTERFLADGEEAFVAYALITDAAGTAASGNQATQDRSGPPTGQDSLLLSV
ncbi:MAG TPA: hypothetical protein VE733_21925 [Streptosporangiaceae bacterium]|nr:hypothetical protein [Streptosporangiaceae bacterium]